MKVLIISHNPVGNANNMGKTFLSLFSAFRREELCQLYIYPTLPDVDCCESYYRVTDKDILRSLVSFQSPGGEVLPERISVAHTLFENPEDEAFYRSRRNKSPVRRILRDGMWRVSRWYSSQLRQWLDREQPTCIFVAPGIAKFLYDMALRIAKERNIPIVTYICDEYYFVEPPRGLAGKLQLSLLQRKIECLMRRSAHLAVICRELQQDYAARFGVPASVIMTGTAYPVAREVRSCPAPRSISYFGNIRCNRYQSLARIGRELDAINAEGDTDYRLLIYTAEKDPAILAAFEGTASVRLCGFVTGEAFERALHNAELLLHVEAFDPESIDRVRHSLSTKIADSLASGIPLLAYGPAEVASMGHLLRSRCALTAVDDRELGGMLRTAFSDEKARIQVVENALETARSCHDSRSSSMQLRQILAQTER